MLDLFKLRRCWEDLEVSPQHPGCAYGEMKMCMEPCKGACTREEYAAEAERVRAFLETNGESMLEELAARRERASEAMDFEAAAAVHKQWEKVKAATQLADEIVRPLMKLRALIVQAAAPRRKRAHATRRMCLRLRMGELLDRSGFRRWACGRCESRRRLGVRCLRSR